MWNSSYKSFFWQVVLAFLTGLFLYLPFSRHGVWFFVFPALLLLLWIRKGTFWFLSGFFFFFLSLRCANIASVEYGGVNPLVSYGLFVFFVIFLSLYQFYAPLWFNGRLFASSVWSLPALYVVFEVLRSYFPYGGFPWLVLGSLSVYIPFVKDSLMYLMVYVQSLLFFYSALLLFLRRWVMVVLLWIAVASAGVVAKKQKEEKMQNAGSIEVALVQTAVPQEDKLDTYRFKRHAEDLLLLVKSAAEKGVDLIVLPESAFHFFYSDEEDEYNSRLRSLSFKTPILVGLVDVREGLKPYNSAYLLKDGTAVDYYDKIRLFPIGEYVPFPFGFLKEVFPSISGMDYVPGRKTQPLRYNGISIATPICFEVAYYDLVKRLSEKADFIAVLTNDGWFKDSDCTAQHYLWARVRALETGKYVLWVNNSGDTGIIDPMGRIVERMPYMRRGVVYGKVLLLK